MAEKKARGLGRGLSALMADVPPTTTATDGTAKAPAAERMIPIEQIRPNPDQPRRKFTEDQLHELAKSIEERGVIQPLILRAVEDGMYEIVAGERRWRASQIARLHEVPAIVRQYNDTEVLEVAIIENIQRADLDPVEEAAGYRQLMERFGHTQEKIAEALGKSRSHIANSMRLLNLPIEVQDMLSDGTLSAGHARALITTDNPLELARQVVAKGLSVRETEKLAKKAAEPPAPKRDSAPSSSEKDADTRALESDLSAAIGMKTRIDHKPGGEAGRVTIEYATLEELDELCQVLSRGR
ncbi:ParB/RepB/Spo0J family partition protein [Psychromarinibacter halotolerans]|uniref:ParB/RepB/Spo0J family partition protein n=1 Tax=Psychromarinibacter halotolerans TaxID=1775175 RepID=A0ABV7GJE2_9RHOB|nr:ParB/RepB/Spo0J family partition protein [Psychromarinibacter halotolerans]MDF0595869.1 ParB/RepB/Spo0J family partition protein [Psychromarinibacter halotolerans]